MKSTEFPKYVNDYPIGEDLFEGKSQDKVAENIISYLKENSNSKKRVIGIDGEWGSGKSNVIEIIRKKTDAEFHIFTFDAWGHQEDLTRRTFLEELSDDLIKNKLLSSKWIEKLKIKLATNRITISQDTPEFNTVLVSLVLLVLLSPIIKKIFEYFMFKFNSGFPGLFSSLLTLAFIIICFSITWFCSEKENRPTLGRMFLLYKGQQIKTTKHETITSLEPSVREFRKILKEITSDIINPIKLIYVFDNLDRLPAKKVKEIWSSIHTFFAEMESNVGDSWVLIPYDEKHICKIFGDDNNPNNDLTVSYIQKTFSIVFRIAPPILSDWKMYFENKFIEAFNYPTPAQEQLVNLFDYLNNDYTIKPRQILDYINNLVVINKQWRDEIPLRYCGLFILTKSQILENPVKVIIEKSFISNVESIFAGDENLEKYISSLVFNVDIDKANEVLLRRSIERTLRGEISLSTISNHPAFISVLDSCFYNTAVNINKTISAFDSLPAEIKNGKGFEKYWKHLTKSFMQEELIFPDCETYYKTLFTNLSSKDIKEDLLKRILIQIVGYKKDDTLVYRGAKYAEIIDDLIKYFELQKIKINVFEYCPKITFSPEDFIPFTESCESDYKDYKITCSEVELNAFISEKTPTEITNFTSFLELTNADFDYTTLIQKIESQIKTLTTSVANFEILVNDLFTVYNIVSNQKPHSAKIPANHALTIFTANVNQAKAIDLVLSILSDIPNRPTYIINPHVVTLLNKIDKIEYAASIAEYHMDLEALIDLALSGTYPLINEVVKAIIYKSYGKTRMSLKNVLIQYSDIRDKLIKSDDEYSIAFIKRLNGGIKQYTTILEENDYKTIIDLKLIEDCTLVSNEFSKLTIQYANKYLLSRNIDDWREAFNDSDNSYLFKLPIILIKHKILSFTKMPEDATNAYKEVIVEFAKTNSIPTNYDEWDLLLEYFDGRKLKLPFREVRDKYIYSPDNISPEAMAFFEKGLFAHGGLEEKDKVADVVRKIIIPSINDKSLVYNIIINNKEKVLNLIKKAKDYKDDIIDAFKLISDNEIKAELKFFSESLGFSFEQENDGNKSA